MKIKNLIKVIATVSLCVSATAGAALNTDKSEKDYLFKGDVEYATFCEAVLNDDLSLLKTSIRHQLGDVASSKRSALRILLSDNGVKCDGENLVEFSIQREASNVYAYLKK